MTETSELKNSQHDQLPVGLITQLVEHCTLINRPAFNSYCGKSLYYDYCGHHGHVGHARLSWSGRARISGNVMHTVIEYDLDFT